MKIQPVAGPHAIQTPQATGPNSSQQQARAKAIAMLTQGAPQAQPAAQPVQNQNSIAPEEMGALTIPKPNILEDSGQNSISEAPAQSADPVLEAEAAKQTDEAQSVSSRLAMLARREKALRAKAQQQESAIKAREAALQAREAELQAKAQTDLSGYIPKSKLMEDPLSALAEAELSWDDLAQRMMNVPPTDPRVQTHIGKLEQQIAKLSEQIESNQKARVQEQQEAYQAAVRQIETQAKHLINTDPNFETVKITKSTKDVVKLIEDTYKEDGRLLSVEEAAQMVEDYLVDQITQVAKISKIQSKLHPHSAAAKQVAQTVAQKQAPESTQPQPQQPAMKTLTNANSVPSRQLSARERAVLAFKGQLK